MLEPDSSVHDQMAAEVTDDWHPEHIHSYGPEQEYISRFYADRWHQISVCFNFQLYRLSSSRAIHRLRGPSRLPKSAASICAEVHATQFTSYPKPWKFVGACPDELEQQIQTHIEEAKSGQFSGEAD